MWTLPPGARPHPARGTAVLLAALLAAAGPATAEEAGPRGLPATADVSGSHLVLNGSAVRTVWGFEVYRVGLYLEAPSGDADAILRTDRNPKRVHIIMLRSVGADQFTGTVQESIDRNFSPEEKESFAAELSRFLGFFHGGADLKPGSEVVLDYEPARGMVALVDGREAGAIPGHDFYHAILRLWLAKPLQASIREGLLGRTGR